MTKIVFDCNIYDLLAPDTIARERIRHMSEVGAMSILVPDTLEQELGASPFGGVPDWFPTQKASDSVFVIGYSRLGKAGIGEGKMYSDHLGDSCQISDAVIADVAECHADIFVSEDARARKRLARFSQHTRSLNFIAFRKQVLRIK